MERELSGWGYLLHLLFVIYGNAMGISSVAEAGECGRLVQKVETDSDVLRLAACDGAYKPFLTFALGYYVVIACFGCQYAGFVPCGGYRGYETGTFLFAQIAGRTVGQHLQSALKAHVECHLIGTCS